MAVNLRTTGVFLAVAGVTFAVMIGISLAAAPGSTYRWSFLFLGVCVWALFALRHRLCLTPVTFGLLSSALLLHNLGAFGFYRREFGGLEFDTYVHLYFGLCGAAAMRGLFVCYGSMSGAVLWASVVVGILGLGAIHEMIEWASTLVLGPERGMLKNPALDPYDTHQDLFNNMLGALLWMGLSSIPWRRRSK
jgi:uncharacterized membrane protein YjdF